MDHEETEMEREGDGDHVRNVAIAFPSIAKWFPRLGVTTPSQSEANDLVVW